ncbi:alkaline phosphatase-like protein [Daedalea quercina L-15889]|uniref:Alkaline phosphatase-like protein n=1 Tax=Daedalea quercina L-15889 TaxID=1314783 RepID=A0A165MDI5_9APHY|nr:alkaline phosphatase-like protein [Daedalea quercina L-15889]
MSVRKGVSLLAWVFFVHLAGLYLYTRGFLLTRLALSEKSACSDGSCTLPPTHQKAIVLIIDALRFDFVSPDPPHPASLYHHNVLTVAHELTATHPSHSFLFDSFADPPTTTSQRIKGLTTGSLPTFIDMGSNFGGASVAEDSLISQLRDAGKQVAFMGDDTWNTIYMDMFAPDMCFPYDSFNVEDLHTVDEGVIRHLFPLMNNASARWDLIIGHFLGVDHVGHRVGPDHPKMHAKLKQMDDVLRRIVDEMAEDTLLVVLGDHGMDKRGDHGGDGELETSAALWVYSKTPLLLGHNSAPLSLLPTRLFPGANVPHRYVQQIDLVPSLALLLGIPIPYNNLGTIIPELFGRDGQLERALKLNVEQVKRYLDTYRASSSGGELDGAWGDLQERWAAVQNTQGDETQWIAMEAYTRLALAVCRELWAQFNVTLIGLGLTVLAVGTLAAVALYIKFGELKDDWVDWATKTRWLCVRGMAVGSVLGFAVHYPLRPFVKGIDALDCIVFGAPLASSLVVIAAARPSLASLRPSPFSVLHALAFASNSFTIWEDRLITYLLLSSVIPSVLVGFSAPTARLRYRILGFSALFAGCVRAMAASTVCREEQHPYCHVTFFASSSLPEPPLLVLVLAVPTALGLPWAVRRFLQTSKSDNGVAEIVLPWLLPIALLQSAAHWIAEWLDTADVLGPEWHWILRTGRTLLAQGAMGSVVLFGMFVWWYHPLCLSVSATQSGDAEGAAGEGQPKTQVTILGFANAFGASYLVVWCAVLAIVYTTMQLTGQVVLALAAVAVLAHVEVVDSVRDVRAFEAAFASMTPSAALDADTRPTAPVSFAEILPLATLALHAFFATGHQAAIPSIQWKTAFVLTPKLSLALSPATVILNTLGPTFLLALAAPLVALWNVAPLPHPAAGVYVTGGAVRAALGAMLYHALLLLGSAASSAWLRRHLMVWKVFAPRFMLAAVSMIAVDVAVLLGVGVVVGRITAQAGKLFGKMSQPQADSAQNAKSTK